jgi:hypothetical protein
MILDSQVAPLTRRDFLKQISALTVSGAILLPDLKAEDAKFVIAETTFGKVRGIDNKGIKIFKAYLTERIPRA